MTKIRWFSLFFVVAGVFSASAAFDVDVPKEIPDEPFDLTAARLEYTNDVVLASGGVTGRFENVKIFADQIAANTQSGNLTIKGNILFERDNVIWKGSYLDYNYISQTGNFGPSLLNFDPVLMSVEHMERVSSNEYVLKGATFTSCTNAQPHFYVRAQEARLVDEKYLTAKGVKVYAGDVPVFYLPIWKQKLSKGILTFKLGYGSEWGASALIRATVPLSQQLASMTDLNLYSKRGVGVGQGFQWESPDRVGLLGSFYLKDEDPHSKYDQASVFGQEINEERYRFKLEHVERFDQEHYVNTRWNYLSDPAVLAEFFRREYRSFAQPENYASWVYGNHYIGSEAFSNYRLNDFYNNTDRGEYSFDLYRTKLKGTPLYLQSENSIAHLERVYTNGISGSAYDSVRLDSKTTLFLPQRYGWLSLVPRAGSRATYYSKDEFSNEEIRYIPDAGMELSFQATKVLSNRERWYGQGLRHKIEPYLDYIFEDSSVNNTNDLRQFDAIDALQDEEKVKIGLRNILQTKRNNRTSRFIDLDFYTHYLVEDHGAGDNFDSLFVDARMPLTKRLMVDALGECNWNSGTIPFFNTRIYYDRDDMVLGLEHLHRDGLDSLWTARADLFPESRVSFEGYVRYSDRDNDVEEIAATAYMTKCCMRYALGGRVYDDDEISVMFSIGLAAFPEARISSSL